MKAGPPLAALRAALRASRGALDAALVDAAFEPLADTGLAHWHVRLAGTRWLARIPKQSQMGLAAADNLAYQAACFERAAPGGHTPALRAVLAPSASLPRGALLVEAIDGLALTLPRDLAGLIDALASLHHLPLPEEAARPPLRDPADPLAALAAEIDAQAAHLDAAVLAPAARRRIDAERARWQRLLATPSRPPRRLIAFDAHPGNYLRRRADGRVMLVDLEKARYGAAALDLAHATLYTSTTWDLQTSADLALPDVASAYAHWRSVMVGAAGLEDERTWFAPLRRAMWLWSVTWCAMWRVQSGAAPRAGGDGADWSAAQSESALAAHVRERVDHYLSPEGVDRVCDEADALAARWGAER